MRSVIALTLLCILSVAHAANYAVLVAGSNGYYNYRHQSDICHAFHILTDQGTIPAENVIVFMYDDIANSSENPVKGNLINHPNGTNVYPGVNKDYTGEAVTPDNFLAAITGSSTAKGKVLKSGPEDNVFIYFSDHGGPGLIAFPSSYLYADALNKALETMHQKNMYKQLVFYLEACESGSMFDKLLSANISIFATSASTPDQSSYACYYDSTRGTYLGDEYSVRWMEDSDEHNTKTPGKWSLENQFNLVQKETLESQPQQYGDLTIDSEDITDFQATFHKGEEETPVTLRSSYTPCGNSVDSRDVKVATLKNRIRDAEARNAPFAEILKLGQEYETELLSRATWDLNMDNLIRGVVGSSKLNAFKATRNAPKDFDCLRGAVDGVEISCGKFTDYSLKWVYTLVNMCEAGVPASRIAEQAKIVCARR